MSFSGRGVHTLVPFIVRQTSAPGRVATGDRRDGDMATEVSASAELSSCQGGVNQSSSLHYTRWPSKYSKYSIRIFSDFWRRLVSDANPVCFPRSQFYFSILVCVH